MPDFSLDAWIHPLAVRVEEDRVVLSCPTAFHRERVRERFLAPIERCKGLGTFEQGQAAARAGAQIDLRMFTGCSDKIDDVRLYQFVDIDGTCCGLRLEQLLATDHLAEIDDRVMLALPIEHVDLVRLAWVAQVNAHDEAIDLRFRQGKRAFVLDRILCGQD